MRKSLKKLKETDELLDESSDGEGKEKKPRKKRVKERKPNVWGGGFVIVSLVVIFLAMRAFPTQREMVKGAKTQDAEVYAKQQAEKTKAIANVKEDLQETSDTIADRVGSVSVLDSAMKSMDKVSGDIDAAKKLPEKTVETVKNLKIGEAISIGVASVSRLSKVYSDLKGVQVEALKKLEEIQ